MLRGSLNETKKEVVQNEDFAESTVTETKTKTWALTAQVFPKPYVIKQLFSLNKNHASLRLLQTDSQL